MSSFFKRGPTTKKPIEITISDSDDYEQEKPIKKKKTTPAKTPKTDKEIKASTDKRKASFNAFAKRGPPIALGSKELPVGEDGCLNGLSFVLTGELDSTSRDDAADLIKRYGGRVTGAPSGKTSYVVVGREPGPSKMAKVEKLGLKTLDEDGLFELIRSAKGTVDQNKPKPKPEKLAEVKETKADMWTVKYAPTDMKSIIGNKGVVESLQKFLVNFKPISTGKDDKRAALLSGPPGIGKTTAAHVVARECGFEVLELNASDVRNKASIENVVGQLIGNYSIQSFTKADSSTKDSEINKKHCLIIDECDGMTGSDRGGIQQLIQLLKKTKIPIICICNDRMHPKVRSLANHCLDLKFIRPSAQMIRSRLMTVAFREKIKIEPNAVDQLVASTQSDIRQVLNMMQNYALTHSELDYDKSKQLGQASKKNVDMSPFDIAGRLMTSSSRSATIEDRMELYFADYQLVPPFVSENYLRMNPARRESDLDLSDAEFDVCKLEYYAEAADALSLSDMVESRFYSRQEFTLMPVHALIGVVYPLAKVYGTMGERLYFPMILGQTSKKNKCWRLLTEVAMHLALKTSSDKHAVRQNYMDILVRRITDPILKQGQDAIPGCIELLDQYFLTKDDWESMLELSLGDYYVDVVMKKIPTAVKSAFTRQYNKMTHNTPFALINAKKAPTREKSKFEVDLEEVADADYEAVADVAEVEEVDAPSDDKMIKSKPIKSKRPSEGKAPAAKRAKK